MTTPVIYKFQAPSQQLQFHGVAFYDITLLLATARGLTTHRITSMRQMIYFAVESSFLLPFGNF
jgi:hypothetical protein